MALTYACNLAKLMLQLEWLKSLYQLGDIDEVRYIAARTRIKTKMDALQRMARTNVERAAELLRNFGELWGEGNRHRA